MGNRPSNSENIILPDPITYDAYNRGYKSGAQTSMFIGPIWVEELVSLQVRSQTTDVPVWGYSNPYYGDILQGNYQVTGQLAVSYTEPDYLLRIVNTARNASIQDDELVALIEQRKSIFLDTVKYKLIQEQKMQGSLDINDISTVQTAERFVQRITREVETTVLNTGGTVRSNAFEITIITGNIESGDSSIDIYEGVKIMGTGKVISTDDTAIIEMYEFMGRKKPDLKKPIVVQAISNRLSKANLMSMAKEVTDKLIDRVMEPPTMLASSLTPRAMELGSTDKIAIAGHLPRKPRFYGKECSFSEISFAMEHPDTFTEYTDENDEVTPIVSDSKLKIYNRDNTTPSEVDIRLTCPFVDPVNEGQRKGFDNRFGRLVSPDREHTANHVNAVAPIAPASIIDHVGGSIVMPRYESKEFEIGSYYPPEIVDISTFEYDEEDLPTLTAGTLWCNTLGFRSSTSKYVRAKDLTPEELASDARIGDIAQPMNTLAIIGGVMAEWEEDEDTFSFKIDVPRAIDYVNTHKGSDKVTKREMLLGKPGHFLNIRMDASTEEFDSASTRRTNYDNDSSETATYDWISIEGPLVDESNSAVENTQADDTSTTTPPPVNDWKIYENSEFAISYESIDMPLPSTGDPDTLSPHYFEITLNITQADLATSLNKTLYITPFVFMDNDSAESTLTSYGPPPEYGITVTPEKTPSGTDIDSYFGSDDKSSFDRLAYFLSSRNGNDDSCSVEIVFDCVVADQTGYYSTDGRVKIYGIYFIKTSNDYDTVVADDGSSQSRTSLGDPRQVRVFFLAGIMPLLSLPTGKEDTDAMVDISHTVEGQSGRYLEIYNITRCDAMLHNAQAIVDLNAGIWQAVKNAIIAIFQDLLNIDAPVTGYTYPVKASWDRFAGFLDGYSIRVNYGIIADQIKNCSFTTEGIDKYVNRAMEIDSSGRKWTLAKALTIAEETVESKASGLNSETEDEIESMVIGAIESKVTELGGTIIDRNSAKRTFVIDMEVLMPASDVVSYGLSSAGYEYLSSLTTSSDDTTVPTGYINLGGYTE